MPDYSKALSTYKKINNIKSSALNISKAKQDINERKMKAIRKNEEIGRDKQLFNSLAKLGVNASAIGATELNLISGEDSRTAGTAASGILSLINEKIHGTVKNAGALGQDAAIQAQRNNEIDFAGNALETYNTLDSNLNRKKGIDIRKSLKKYVEENDNISEDEIMTFLNKDDVSFEKGEGYSIKPEDIISALRKKGDFLKDSGQIEDTDNFIKKKGFELNDSSQEEDGVFSQNKYDF